MSSLVLAENFRELSDEEMQDVNGGVIKVVGVGAVLGAGIGAWHAHQRGECLIAGAVKGAFKGAAAATMKVAALIKWPASKVTINQIYYGNILLKAGIANTGW